MMTRRNVSVFVNKISGEEDGKVVVDASNGSKEGPPFIRFEIGTAEARDCHIGTRYFVTISEDVIA